MSDRTKIPIRELEDSYTNLEIDIWDFWIREENNRPSRTDYYIMQLTRLFALAHGAKGNSLDDYKLEFDNSPHLSPTAQEIEQARKEQSDRARLAMITAFGIKNKEIKE